MKRFWLSALFVILLIVIAILFIPIQKSISITGGRSISKGNSIDEEISIKVEGNIKQYLFREDVFDGRITLGNDVLETRYGSTVYNAEKKNYTVVYFAAYDAEENAFSPVLLIITKDYEMAAVKFKECVYLCNPHNMDEKEILSLIGFS